MKVSYEDSIDFKFTTEEEEHFQKSLVIDGQGVEWEKKLLYNLAKRLGPREYAVELGSRTGNFSVPLAQGCKDADSHVYCIDHFVGDTTGGVISSPSALWDNLHKASVADYATILNKDFYDINTDMKYYLRQADKHKTPGLIFYDAAHWAGNTLDGIIFQVHGRTKEAVIVIHDSKFDGVKFAVRALTTITPNFKVIGENLNVYNGIVWLQYILVP